MLGLDVAELDDLADLTPSITAEKEIDNDGTPDEPSDQDADQSDQNDDPDNLSSDPEPPGCTIDSDDD